MNNFKKIHIRLLILICIACFVFPFFTKSKEESLNTTLAISFTAVSTIVSIITLIVAVILFDKYGLNAKFKEKQLETVLSLIYELKLLSLTVSNGELTYMNYIRKCINLKRFPKNTYDVDKTKILLVPDNFYELLTPLYILYSSPWLPSEIKKEMNFLNIYGTNNIDDFDNSKYVSLNINNQGKKPWVITTPIYTFDSFSNSLFSLLTTTLQWLDHHSSIEVDFDLIEEKY